MSEWTLVYAQTGRPAANGEKLCSFRGEVFILDGGRPPHKPESSGRVFVTPQRAGESPVFPISYYPHVFGLKWVRKN